VLSWLAERRPGRSLRLAAVVEAKGPGTGAPLAEAIQAAGLADRVAICAFDPNELRAAAAVVPTVARMLIVDRDRPDDDPIVLAAACHATIVNVPWTWLERSDVDRLHASGLLVAGGTADTPDAIDRCLRLGLDAVDSNDPALAVRSRRLALERRAAEDA
jgi:glycerophosphoryl diester phosphodiesterase